MLVKTTEYEISGNMPGHTESMSLSSDSLEHIMDILSDLYSNRSAAVIREYTTNALDSHLISGQTKPIEISTPNRMNPNLVIRDFGTGMSKQVLIDTYSKYGASTKRNNNIEAGQLGLGSKSGFAYTDQFIVRSIHDGYCCEIIMSRNDRGAAEMNIAMEYETDQENGVTVTIPIASEDVDSVRREAWDFATYASPGKIMIDGKINSLPDHIEKIADNFYASSNITHHIVVMGNVAYKANLFPDNWVPWNGKRIIAFVQMGEVDFTPSREELKYTNHTKATIAKIESYVRAVLTEKIKDTLVGDQPRYEIMKKIAKLDGWRTFVDVYSAPGLKAITDGTEHITARIPSDINNPTDRLLNQNTKSLDTSGKMVWRDPKSYGLGELHCSLQYFIVDFPHNNVNRQQAAKIIQFNSDFAGQNVTFFAASKSEVDDLFEDMIIVSWNDIKSIKTVRTKRERVADKSNGRYLGHLVHKKSMSRKRYLGANGRVYYISRTDLNEITRTQFPREDFKLILVTKGNQPGFAKKHPNAKSLMEYVDNRRKQIRLHIENNPHVIEAIEWRGIPRILREVNLSEITNEEVRSAIKRARTGIKWSALSGKWYRQDKMEAMISQKYPLISSGYSYNTNIYTYSKHAIQYINMIGEINA